MQGTPTPNPSTFRWLFAGQGPMGAAALKACVERSIDLAPPVAVLTAEPPWGFEQVTAAATVHGLPVEHVEAVGPDPARRWPDVFAQLDVAVCCCWAERLAPQALGAPAHGWLNLHPSALPRWRGADPVAWQLLAGASRIPCSVHRMTEGQDEGAVVAGTSAAVEDGDDRGTMLHRTGDALGRAAAGVLADLAAGLPLRERPQDPAEATWCPPSGTVPQVDPRSMHAGAGMRVARAFSPLPGIAVAALPPDQRFAATGLGSQRQPHEPPGAVVTRADDDGGLESSIGVAIAFLDRWVRGRSWSVASGTALVHVQSPNRQPRSEDS